MAKVPSEEPVAGETPLDELRDRVLSYLADYPEGSRLLELEKEFGVARIRIARVSRELMDDNLVAKRELLYFAT